MVEYNFKRLKKIAEELGWEDMRTHGSHHQYKKSGIDYLVTIPNHGNKAIAKGTAEKILKQLGYKK